MYGVVDVLISCFRGEIGTIKNWAKFAPQVLCNKNIIIRLLNQKFDPLNPKYLDLNSPKLP